MGAPTIEAPMRHWFAILLLVLMPLQALWASAAPYCEHEQAAAASKHLGHHEHEHPELDASQDQSPGKVGASHTDCHVCQGSATAPVVGEAIGALSFVPRHPSIREASVWPAPPLTRPDRPKWQLLA